MCLAVALMFVDLFMAAYAHDSELTLVGQNGVSHFYPRCLYAGLTTATSDETGPVPRELGGLTALRKLILTHNHLEGVTPYPSMDGK